MLFKKLKGGGEINTFCPKSIYYNKNFYKVSIFKKHILNLSKNKKLFRNTFINVDTSHSTTYELEKDNVFKDFFKKILEESKLYLLELGYNNEFIKKVFVESAWFNIGKKGDNLIKHIHPGSFLSGAFYVSCDDKDQIVFFGDDDMTLPPQNFNNLSSKYTSYECIPSSLLLFKSNINHCTSSQKSKEKITISFNLNYIKNNIQ
tara:strand:- start:131 stop:742 length:612 start_codon:yes stop_codon:yes gene_type:complete